MLKFYGDFDAIAEISGTLAGIKYITEDTDKYMETLLREAHGDATKEFDKAAASMGAAGAIKHMFEYGTAGVTPGPQMFSPLDTRAHLWEHRLIGKGGNMEVSFNFKPAMVPNPKPTTESTGVEARYLKFLSNRKYVFWNRALVMEMGTEVSIKAKNGQYLFVPFYGNPSYNNFSNNRGYMMWDSNKFGPIRSIPGLESRGKFGLLWDGWWSASGQRMMEADVYKNYSNDLKAAIAAAELRSKRSNLRPVSTVPVRNKSTKAKAKRSTETGLLSRAMRRLGRR